MASPTVTPNASDPIDEFIALPKDQQLTTLQQLAPDKQDALLAKVKERRSKQQPTAPSQPGFLSRLGQGMGLPSLDMLKDAPYATAQYAHGQIPESPIIAAGKALFHAGKDAIQHPSEENTGKLATGFAAPFVGAGVQNLPEDVKQGNVGGSAGDILSILGNLALLHGASSPTAEASTNKLAYAGGKGTAADIGSTLQDLQKAAQGKPVSSLNDFHDIVKKAKTDLNAEASNALAPIANRPTVPMAIGQKIRDLIRPNMDMTPEGLKEKQAIENAAIQFEKPGWTYGKLDAERMKRNADLGTLNSQAPGVRYTSKLGNVNKAIDQAAADGIRDLIYPQMDAAAGKPTGYFRDLKQRHGDLIHLDDSLFKRVKDLEDQQARIAGAPSKISAMKTAKAAAGSKAGLLDLAGAVLGGRENPLKEANQAAEAGFGGGPIRRGVRAASNVAIKTLPARYLTTLDSEQVKPALLPPNHPLLKKK